MSYFDSDIVKKEFEEMFELEDELMKKLLITDMNTKEGLLEIRKLIDKQKIVYTRLSLSDDPLAKEYKKKFDDGVARVFPGHGSVLEIYNAMDEYMQSVEESFN